MELDLRDNKLSEDGCRAVLPTLLDENARLERLSLSANPIRDVGACLLAELLEDGSRAVHLKHLDLARASITDAGCCRLAKSLETNTTLQTLGLAHNAMSNVTYVAFGKALKDHNRTLVSINLQCDRKKIDISGCEALLKMVEENYTMETVSTNLGTSYELKGIKFGYSSRIRMFLRLNHLGRQKLLDQKGTKEDWINTMISVQDSIQAIHYLLTTNPSLCQRD
uniref:Uncharacterized protein n=1 Tax=Entomoneis paludosa TaxID=265537 RepID=A0A7S2YFL6_9STRA